nr:unnamed protein product [uncultured bacterium]
MPWGNRKSPATMAESRRAHGPYASGAFRSGAFQLADTLQLPVVPITIDGSFDILPRTRGFNFVNWHPLRIVVHAPIAPTGRGAEHVHRVMHECYRIIMADLPERHRGFVENPDQ